MKPEVRENSMKDKSHYIRTLTIAGSDSGGGAGIQADLKTFSALGCYGMSVITALTAQNTVGVTAIQEVPHAFVEAQLEAVLSDIGANAVKIGMLQSPGVIRTVAASMQKYRVSPLVIDPVMYAKSGDKLLQDDAIAVLRDELLPLATIITPNVPEAEVLSGRKIQSRADMESAGRNLMELGMQSVCIKGGHGIETGADCLCLRDGSGSISVEWLVSEHIDTPNTHGSGCTLSSAMAAFLAQGNSIPQAVRQAKDYISHAIRSGARYLLGKGKGPVNHFYDFSR